MRQANKIMVIKNAAQMGGVFYFFLDFDGFLNSLYSISADVNANNAEAAVINPEIRPFENHANKTTDKINTIVMPRFLANTFSIFSKVFMFLPFRLDVFIISQNMNYCIYKKRPRKPWSF